MPKIQHVVLPGQVIGEAESRARETVASFLRRTGWDINRLPTICVVNDAPVLRAEWRKTRIRKTDVVVFQSRPLGSGGSSSTKSTIGLIGMIALAALSGPFAGLFAAAGTFTYGLLAAGFIAGGSFLLNTFLSPGAKTETQQQSLYSFGNQTNSARPLDVIPVRYGRTKVTPDYAAVPWSETIGDDLYLNLLLVNGLGRYQRDQILIDDTVLWDRTAGWNASFTDVQVQFVEPGDAVTLFPVNVATSVEVAGQELADPAIWIAGGVINNAGTTATRLVFDVAYPAGLCVKQSNGKLGQYLSHVQFEIRPVNSSGLPTGSWTVAAEQVFARSSDKPFRASLSADVAPGRYEVRGRRVVAPAAMTGAVDQVLWVGARAYLTGGQTFAGLSLTAIRMKATGQLTQGSSGKFGFIDTRILPVWTGSSWVEQPTRLPAYAALDIATNVDYGARRPSSKVDLQELVTLATTAAARGDFFDYEFRATVPVSDALDTALGVCRAKHRWLGDVLSVVREKWHPVPSMLITDREIVRGSFSVDYLLQPEDSADSLILEYLDQDTWNVETVQVPEGMSVSTASRVQIPGIQQRAHAYRECAFLWRQNAFRRIRPTITTEQDGRLLAVGSVITLQSEIPMEWGASGAVVQRSGNTLTLDPAPAWESGQSYIILRQPAGEPFGPIKVSRGASDEIAVLDATDLALVQSQQGTTLAAALARVDGDAPASFALGLGTDWQQRCIVMSGAPDGDQVQLELVVDYEEVHDDSGSPEDVPPAAALAIPKTPLVTGLIATLEQNLLEPVLSASWSPAAGAISYTARVSYDGGVSWAPLTDTTAPSFSVVVEPRALRLGVAAVGSGQGPYTVIDIEAPTITGDKLPAELNAQALRELVGRQLDGVGTALDDLKADQALLLADVMSRIDDQVVTGNRALRSHYNVQVVRLEAADAAQVAQITSLQTSTDTAFAGVNSTLSSLTTATSALATSVTDLEATIGDVSASLRVEWVASATPAGALAAYQMRAKAEESSVGFYMVAQSGGTGYVAVEADKFLVRSSAGTNFALFDTVGGALYLKGSLYADGSITTPKVATGAISTDKLQLGGVTFDRLALQAATNYVAAYTEGGVTSNPFKSTTLGRISGTAVDIMLSFEIPPFSISLPNIANPPPVTLRVIVERVAPGGGVTTILSRLVPMTVTGYAASPTSFYATVSLPFFSIPFTDFGSVAEGVYTYNLKLGGAEYYISGGTSSFDVMAYSNARYSYLKTSEFRR